MEFLGVRGQLVVGLAEVFMNFILLVLLGGHFIVGARHHSLVSGGDNLNERTSKVFSWKRPYRVL